MTDHTIYNAIVDEDYERGAFEQMQKECERLAIAVNILFNLVLKANLVTKEEIGSLASNIQFCNYGD